MAEAGHEFVNNLLKGLSGQKGVVACTMIESAVTSCEFFATKVELGPGGVHKNLGLGTLSAFEQNKLDKEVIPQLKGELAKGTEFANKA